MFDYENSVKQIYGNFLKKQQDFLSITLVNDRVANPFMTSINDLYLLKFDPQYKLRSIDFVPPDFPEETSVIQSNLFAIFDNQDDIPYIKKFLIEIDSMTNLYPGLKYLLNIALYRKE
jgi:hypothetical protein